MDDGKSQTVAGTARGLILDRGNSLLVSAVSVYELEWKPAPRRLDLPLRKLRAALRRNAVEDLDVTHQHAEHAACLDWSHRDPWDRILAAPASLENSVLLSTDSVFDAAGVDRHW